MLLRHIDSGRPLQNGHLESFNGRFRDECLNANWFRNLTQPRLAIQRRTNSLRSSRSDKRNQL